jgi:uncharacterized protein with NRDE domain
VDYFLKEEYSDRMKISVASMTTCLTNLNQMRGNIIHMYMHGHRNRNIYIYTHVYTCIHTYNGYLLMCAMNDKRFHTITDTKWTSKHRSGNSLGKNYKGAHNLSAEPSKGCR